MANVVVEEEDTGEYAEAKVMIVEDVAEIRVEEEIVLGAVKLSDLSRTDRDHKICPQYKPIHDKAKQEQQPLQQQPLSQCGCSETPDTVSTPAGGTVLSPSPSLLLTGLLQSLMRVGQDGKPPVIPTSTNSQVHCCNIFCLLCASYQVGKYAISGIKAKKSVEVDPDALKAKDLEPGYKVSINQYVLKAKG
eukprot:1787013-Ditylum_brightwellii.AAC.1